MHGKFQALYEGIKQGVYAQMYSSFFLTRRLVMAVALVFIKHTIAQLTVVIVIQVSALVYLAIVRPFESVQDNLVNLIDEFAALT